jgi:predicted transcriptional regulator
MDVLYARGSATAAEIRDALPDAPSYSAVRALLRILEDKGHARHEQQGPRYVYSPQVSRDRARRSALKRWSARSLADRRPRRRRADRLGALADEVMRLSAVERQEENGDEHGAGGAGSGAAGPGRRGRLVAADLTAAARHALWRLTVAATLVPLTALISPTWSLLAAPATVAHQGACHSWQSGTPGAITARMAAAPYLRGLWMAGAVGGALYFVAGYLQIRSLRRRARPAPLAWSAAAARLSRRAGLRTPPEIRVSTSVPSPLVTGLLHPTVLIPPTAGTWSDARRDAVLIHELAHVRRGDLVAQFTAQVLVALHWFNPLAWHARYGASVSVPAMPRCCERRRRSTTLRSSQLPRRALPRAPAAAMSMARPSELEGRVVIRGCPHRPRRLARLCLSLVLVGASVTVAGARLRPSVREASPAVQVDRQPARWVDRVRRSGP